ncbi:MAG: peptidase T [Treponema sp.]|jgi:tripeptide aminopeptidase|nr:peptidase T [Treponema sp.]
MESPVRQIGDQCIEKLIVPRFMNYVRYWTESDRHAEETPSTAGQWDLAKALAGELTALGVKDVSLTDHCYVIARLPPSPGKENAPCIGFLAHIDTASDVSGKDVQPQLVNNYNGKKIELAGGLALDPEKEPDLAAQRDRAIIHSDGSTLLGADDKAGVAEIMAAVEYLAVWKAASGLPEIKHGPVEIIFSPDEETGKGLPDFPLHDIKSAVCYTLDGGPIGEIEAECFNAWKADVEFRGKVIHVGAARGILANAVLMASSFAALLPRAESPEATDGYYGYYCPTEIKGNLENAGLEILLRDFDSGEMRRRLAALDAFAKTIEAQFPGGRVIVNTKPQYYNMKEKIDERPEVLERLKTALDNVGIEWRLKPIRGGTDGSRLTELGIPTPNIFTGGRNFHSRLEWVAVSEMCAACKTVIELIRLWGE